MDRDQWPQCNWHRANSLPISFFSRTSLSALSTASSRSLTRRLSIISPPVSWAVSEFNQPGNRHALGTIAAVADLVGVIVRTPRAEGAENVRHVFGVAGLGRGGAVTVRRIVGSMGKYIMTRRALPLFTGSSKLTYPYSYHASPISIVAGILPAHGGYCALCIPATTTGSVLGIYASQSKIIPEL